MKMIGAILSGILIFMVVVGWLFGYDVIGSLWED